jgi:tetratricopeptide (TPR) repeat protein
MRFASQFLPVAVLSLLAAPSSVFPQDIPDIAEARSILREASALVPEIEETQRGSLACNISGPQAKSGDLAGALATLQYLPKGSSRDSALYCSAWALTAQGNWRMAIQNIEDLSENKLNSLAYLAVAVQLAEKRDYENAVAVARLIRGEPDQSRFAADALMQIYAKQFKAGDARGASRTLDEALDIVENVEQHPNPPGSDIASRYENLIQLAVAGGAKAASPILERLYGMAAALEVEPTQKQQFLSHLAPSQALLGDFVSALRSANQLPPGEQRDKALLSIADAQARQGDLAGARLLASEVSPKGWNNPALQEFGLSLAASGDYLGALSTIEKVQESEARAESLGQLALAEAGKSRYWAMFAAQLSLEAAETTADSSSFALQLVAVTRGILGDFGGSLQIINQLTSRARQWPLWNLTEQLVEAGRKNEALALAYSQEAAFPRAYALLGTAAEMLEQIEAARKKSDAR